MPPHLCRTKANCVKALPETESVLSSTAIQSRVDCVDWMKVHTDLDAQGWAIVRKLLTYAEADSIAGLTIRSKASAAKLS